ncbi:MAG: hypothetical protein Q4P24_17680, partial [Rhodobacterales bacterium]|nr:hypothetical protein [Rhodobacterales bacterium]
MGVILTGSGETLKPETNMPLHTTDIQDVDRFETATILAALRLLQAAPALPSEIVEIATDDGDFEPLDDAAIDDLCERINAASAYPFRDVSEEGA